MAGNHQRRNRWQFRFQQHMFHWIQKVSDIGQQALFGAVGVEASQGYIRFVCRVKLIV